jgi:3-keto-disaccharide hydrolase
MVKTSRRRFITTTVSCACVLAGSGFARSGPDHAFDFTKPLDGWETISGNWGVENVPGASQSGRALVQRATDNEYNVIIAPAGPYTNVRVSVRFKPISGREDASGGIIFRFSEGRYYLVRANALEDNFRLYSYDRGRRMLTSASVTAPALGQWHKLQILAKGDHLQGWLNDRALIDHHDLRFTVGRIGLWTKADSVTAFDDLTVLPLDGDD